MRKTCAITHQPFEITEEDVRFYEKMEVPFPTLCPEERQRRRLAWRNDRTLYKRKCDATKQDIISNYHSDHPFPVYESGYWWSDNWNALEYGRDFDFDRPFFEQFAELQSVIPHCSLSVIKPSLENSDYCNQVGNLKDCYLCFDTRYCEKCLYSKSLEDCYECLDCFKVFGSELCYECDFCFNCYGSTYLFNSQNCTECHFGANLVGCKNCFGCVNLRNKQYYFMNQKCSKEEYETKSQKIFSDFTREELLQHFLTHQQIHPRKWMEQISTENCTGSHLIGCKDCSDCYDSEDLEKCKYCFDIKRTRDHSPSFHNYDINNFGGQLTECYECVSIGNGNNHCLLCDNVWGCSDTFYSRICGQGQNIFGCIALRNAKYCILNKQYSKEEYFQLRDKIIEHMKKNQEWGEFLPMELSPFAYNETVASEYFPMTKNEALKRGCKWKDSNKKDYLPQTFTVPNNIKGVLESICKEVLACNNCGKNYKIQKVEIAFHKKMQLPLPKKCPHCRHMNRLNVRLPRKLHNRKCDNCSTDIQTPFSPKRPEKVFCEKCYLDAVN